jgi:hypothetical protein
MTAFAANPPNTLPFDAIRVTKIKPSPQEFTRTTKNKGTGTISSRNKIIRGRGRFSQRRSAEITQENWQYQSEIKATTQRKLRGR